MAARHLIVTRPAAQATPLVDELRSRGVSASTLPLIEIAPAPDPAAVAAAWAGLPGDALAFFASANAVEHFLGARPAGAAWPAATLAAGPGPGTAAALRAGGVPAPRVVEPAAGAASFDSEALWEELRTRDWRGRRVLLVRGEQGRDWLAEQLQAAGAEVHAVAAYRRLAPRPDDAGRALLARALAEPGGFLWHFSSSEAVQHLRTLAPGADWRVARAAATHPRIAAAARALGFGVVDEIAPGVEALVRAALT
jgi:uroporphyrinogen-III synthase